MFSQSVFSDIQNHWAKGSILAAEGRNILKGYPDGTFRPFAPVTRAEFAAIISIALPQQPSSRPGIILDPKGNNSTGGASHTLRMKETLSSPTPCIS